MDERINDEDAFLKLRETTLHFMQNEVISKINSPTELEGFS